MKIQLIIKKMISSPSTAVRRWPLLINFSLVLIIAFGFLVRLYRIDNPIADWHSFRQADTAAVSRIYVQEGINLLYPRYHDISPIQSGRDNPQGYRFVEFPIFNAIHAGFYSLYPPFSLAKWGRLVSVLASTASIILIFFLTKRLLSKTAGLLAAFFFAFLPFNIYFSRVILPDPLSVTFGLAALLAFVSWFDSNKKGALALSAFLFALAVLTKPYTIFYGVPMLWLALKKFNWQWKNLLKDKRMWAFLLISLLPLAFWRIWMLQHPEGVPFIKWVFNSDGIRFKPAFWYWLFGERLSWLILGGWLVLPLSVGLLSKSRSRELWFTLIFAFAMFLYVSVIAGANVRHDYYQTLIIPAVAIALAKGTTILWQTRNLLQPATKAALMLVIIWGLAFSWYGVRDFYQINHPEIIEAGQAADRLLPKDALVIAPYNGDTAFLYYTERRGWPYITYPLDEMIDRLGAQYYVSVNFDERTREIMERYKVLEQTDEYVIVDLREE